MTTELRIKAVELAVGAKHAQQNLSVVSEAQLIYNFLTAANATAEAPAEAPKAKAPRVPKPAATTAAPATSDAQAPATEATVATATSPSDPPAKKLTIDDVRQALVALQTRKGTKAPAQAILEKYSPTKVTGGVKEEDYAKLISECAAA